MVMNDRRLTVNQIANAVSISHERVENILHNKFGVSKVSTQWVPWLLTPDQKHTRLVMLQENFAHFEADSVGFLESVLTQDGCRVHHSEPETKRQSMQWKHPFHPSEEGQSGVIGREGDGLSFLGCNGFIQDQSSYVFDCQTSKIERILLNRGKKSVLGQGYAELNLASDMTTDYLRQVLSFYGLSNKVTATVTDNGSNFVKAFKMYQPVDSDSEEYDEEEDEVTFTDVVDALYTEGDGEFFLPPHHRCASHTINLISTNDVEKWLTGSPDTTATYGSGVAKCTALWTKASHSTVASELVEEVSRRKLLVPMSTRLNSFYEAVTRITKIPISDLNGLCIKLGIKGFTDKEYQFLGEYSVARKPLTVALDILQGEDHCFYSTILLTLEVLMSKTLALKVHLSKMTAGLPDVIVQVDIIQVLLVVPQKEKESLAQRNWQYHRQQVVMLHPGIIAQRNY
ncbi:hypothetical protein ABVT39_007546 [Epinephelus coioides]